jgi:hypothetical protein
MDCINSMLPGLALPLQMHHQNNQAYCKSFISISKIQLSGNAKYFHWLVFGKTYTIAMTEHSGI